MGEIKFLGQVDDDKKNRDDIEWIDEFYQFLQGKVPDNIHLKESEVPVLTKEQAFNVIWYLQEHFRILPDNFEQCSNCGNIYDTHCSGHHSEIDDKSYCDFCECLAPCEDEV